MSQISKEAVEAVLEEAREPLRQHGGNVELVGINDQGVVLVKLVGACSGCASASVTLKDIIEKTLKEKLPEVSRVEALM